MFMFTNKTRAAAGAPTWLRRSLSAIVAVVTLFTGLVGISTPGHAATNHTITVHYFRYEADYDTWNVWMWPKGSAGAAYDFSSTDSFGKVGTFTVPGSAGVDVGFIVRQGAWVAKDVADDRYINTFDNSGNAEVWLIQGDPTIYYSAPNVGPSIRSAVANGFNQIKVLLSKSITLGSGDLGFSLTGPDGTPAVSSVVATDGTSTSTNNVLVNLDGDMQVGNQYTLHQTEFGDAVVNMSTLFDSQAFANAFTYDGSDLGNTYTAQSTAFRVWAPTASQVDLLTFASATTKVSDAVAHSMTKDVKGTWVASLSGDQNGTIYAYQVHVNGHTNVANDPYVRATTVNGGRGVVVNLDATNPSGFAAETKPAFSGKPTDASIYELHVRDLSMDASSGITPANRGKYLAFTEMNTHAPDGKTLTGVSAIKALGVTHVELLPVYDFSSVDEKSPTFNWGYDPDNYNVPEGSYSSDPSNPTARITELKQAIQSMHAAGLRVNMDVVYNHVASAAAFSEEQIVPGYFFRTEADGSAANGTGVGNEVASQRTMVRKFIVDSVKYWATQYHFDGFRFDLMGILDVTTMNAIRTTLDTVDPSIIIIGEGWKMGDVLSDSDKAYQGNLSKMPGIAAFNDGIRDGLKGSVFSAGDTGWATGKASAAGAVKAGIVGQILYSVSVAGSWGNTQPSQSVNYVECHDNLTLYDKLKTSTNLKAANIVKVDQLTASVVILSQGIPFQQAGQEFLRSKQGDDNSYKSSDAINSLKWNTAAANASTVKYYAGLYALRKAHPAFRMATTAAVRANLKFVSQSKGVLSYSLNGKAVGDKASTIFVAHNPSAKDLTVKLPATGNWTILVKGAKAGVASLGKIKGKTAVVPAYSTLVLTK
jgi:pullulanase